MLSSEPLSTLYSCPLDQFPHSEYIPLSSRDVQAFDNFAPISVGYHFEEVMDPGALCQSLGAILPQYPGFTGCMVTLDDVPHVKTWAQPPTVLSVLVPGAVVSSPINWKQVVDFFPLRENRMAGKKLFKTLLLESGSPQDGCALIASVDHVLADANTLSLFLQDWSHAHRTLFGVRPSRPISALGMKLPRDFTLTAGNLTVKRFYFQTERLLTLKNVINEHSTPDFQVTTNDILLAMCACAVATRATPTGVQARIAMMADPRGRGRPAGFLGNAAMPMHIFVSWTTLLSRDLSAVARAVRVSVVQGLEVMKATCMMDPSTAAMNEPALLQWNSWARAQGMLTADFGCTLQQFEWVNLRALEESHVFVVVPVTSEGGLALQAALPHTMMLYFEQIWEKFIGLPNSLCL